MGFQCARQKAKRVRANGIGVLNVKAVIRMTNKRWKYTTKEVKKIIHEWEHLLAQLESEVEE